MNNPENFIWMEKFRPKCLDELILEESTKEILQKFIRQGEIPHLLLSGHVGSGKTTIAKVLLSTLDCDHTTLNASVDRGIDIIREKVKKFAMVSTFKKLKIVFLDEADAITPEAQFAMRNLMETYSEQTRFILTCNYLNKIIEPIRSRCQLIEFQNLQRKQIRLLLERILKEEKIRYSVDDLLVLVDMYYPDIRSMINKLQLDTLNSEWKIRSDGSFRSFEQLLDFIKKGNFKSIRELSIDYTEAYKFLFDKVDELTSDYSKRIDLSLLVAEYLYRETFIADKSINFLACCMAIVEKLK